MSKPGLKMSNGTPDAFFFLLLKSYWLKVLFFSSYRMPAPYFVLEEELKASFCEKSRGSLLSYYGRPVVFGIFGKAVEPIPEVVAVLSLLLLYLVTFIIIC